MQVIKSEEFNAELLTPIDPDKDNKLTLITYRNLKPLISCGQIYTSGVRKHKNRLEVVVHMENNRIFRNMLYEIQKSINKTMPNSRLPIYDDIMYLSLNSKAQFRDEKTNDIMSIDEVRTGYIKHTPIIEVSAIYYDMILVRIYSSVVNRKYKAKM